MSVIKHNEKDKNSKVIRDMVINNWTSEAFQKVMPPSTKNAKTTSLFTKKADSSERQQNNKSSTISNREASSSAKRFISNAKKKVPEPSN